MLRVHERCYKYLERRSSQFAEIVCCQITSKNRSQLLNTIRRITSTIQHWQHKCHQFSLQILAQNDILYRWKPGAYIREAIHGQVPHYKTWNCCEKIRLATNNMLNWWHNRASDILVHIGSGNGLFMDHSVYGLNQWETMLHCNAVSHWLSSYPEWALLSHWKCPGVCRRWPFCSGLTVLFMA